MVLNTRSIQNNCQSIPLPCLWAIYGHFIYFLVTKKSVVIDWRKILTFKHKIHHSVCIGHGQCQQVYIGVNAIFRISCSVNMLSCQSGRDIGLTDVCNQQWTNITVLLTFGRGVNAKIGFFWLVSNLSVPSMNIPKFIGVEKTGCKHFKQTALALLTWYLTKQPLIYLSLLGLAGCKVLALKKVSEIIKSWPLALARMPGNNLSHLWTVSLFKSICNKHHQTSNMY